MWLRKVAFLFLLIITINQNVSSVFKMTNMKCESFNETWAVFKDCRLRAIKRDITVLNLNVDFLHPAYKIDVKIEVLKKANGYRPFLYNITVDACAFIKRRNNPIAGVVYDMFKDFSNINHTCPYVGPQILSGFYPKHELLKLPMPTGEYLILGTWYLHSKKTFTTNVYWTFEEKN